jgi:2-polyprenyl-3-methyl-5-hydroxy-6-metoxy-1,4-benzoquinol methylase/rubredoxin
MTQPSSSVCPICHGRGKHDFSSTDRMFGGSDMFAYHRCTSCGLVYQHPIPDGETIAGFYPDSYSIYQEPARPYFSRRARLTLKSRLGYQHLEARETGNFLERLRPSKPVPGVVPFVPGGKALDIGCGNGEYLLRLRSIGWSCKGVEFNEKAVSICRQHGLDIFHGNLKSANFETGSFDFVTAHHLLEHAPDPHELVGEIARILKQSGTVLIRTPNSNALGRAWFGNNWYANEVPRHLFLYSEHNLERLANDHGLNLLALSKPAKAKLVLKSLDYQTNNQGKPSEKRVLRQWLAKLYVPVAKLTGRGDELFALFEKS